jgi:hypothetical protein
MNQYADARNLTNYGLNDEIDPAKMNAFIDKRLKEAAVNNALKLVQGDTVNFTNEVKEIFKDTCKFGTLETLQQPKNLAIAAVGVVTVFGIGYFAGKKLKIKKKK